MIFPKYWSKATAEASDENRGTVSFSCWRWSDASQQDAQESALAAARRIVQRLISGEQLGCYPYGKLPLREEIIEKFTNEQEELTAAVTQNAYGSFVLNTAQAMFIDVDFPAVTLGGALGNFFSKLFGKSVPSLEAEAMRRLEQFRKDNPGFALRVYRTLAGLRVLVTHALFDPGSDSTLSLFKAVGADPLYVRLCQAQQCFRARLTPKPWRCGHTPNPVAWPRDGDEQQRRFEQWQSEYLERQSKYATCRFLGTIGSGPVHPEIEAIIEVHDRLTRCHDECDLA